MYFNLSFNQKFWAAAVMITIKSTRTGAKEATENASGSQCIIEISETGVFLFLRLEKFIIHKLITRNLL